MEGHELPEQSMI